MERIKFIIVGSGYRSFFYVRIANVLKDRFCLCAMLCRTEAKAERIRQEYQIRTSTDMAECLGMKPDFAVVAVDKPSIFQVTREWASRGIPVLCETPAALQLQDLEQLWLMKTREHLRILTAEQYFLYPHLSAAIAVVDKGYLGKPSQLSISMAHEYHAASLIRRLLNTGFTQMTVSGKAYPFSIRETGSREGLVTNGSIENKERIRITFEFPDGKVAFYDFSGVQYHSFIRSRHLNVWGEDGELYDRTVRYVDEGGNPVKLDMETEPSAGGRGVLKIRLGAELLYENPFGDVELDEDETAIASLMDGMKAWIEKGVEIYPLAEALQDAYTMLLMRKAVNEGCPVCSERQIWQ